MSDLPEPAAAPATARGSDAEVPEPASLLELLVDHVVSNAAAGMAEPPRSADSLPDVRRASGPPGPAPDPVPEPDGIVLRRAAAWDAAGIAAICADSSRRALDGVLHRESLDRLCAEYFSPQRIAAEIAAPRNGGWLGWLVADLRGTVVGAGAAGVSQYGQGEVYTLQAVAARVRAGLLAAISQEHRRRAVRMQWVSVYDGCLQDLRFFEAQGFRRGQASEPWDGIGTAEGVSVLRFHRSI